MTQVYRIDKIATYETQHEINVDETWIIAPDEYFDSLKDAETYVIKMNTSRCGHYLGITHGNDELFIAERCLSTEWCHRQQYFTTRPNIKLLRHNLGKDGIITYGVSSSKIMVSSTKCSSQQQAKL